MTAAPAPLPAARTAAVVWVNGARQPAGAAHLSALDRGFTLADGVFETVRVYGGTAFRLDAHLDRLARAAAALEIALPADVRATALAAVAEGPASASLRITLSRGPGAGGAAPPPVAGPPTVVVAVAPLAPFPPSLYEHGLAAHVASGRRNERAMTAGLKTLSYTDATAALVEARRAGADEAIFLDTRDRCSEAASSNLFAWDGATLLTPPLSCGALPGITRGAVLALAAARGVPADERPFGLDELVAAREAFLTSSLRELAPLVRVDGRALGDGRPGPVTRELAAAYRDLVRAECAA
jgi:branched-chain amino acid aminotransferase